MAEQERDDNGRFAGGGESTRESDRAGLVRDANALSDRAAAASKAAHSGDRSVGKHRQAMQLHHMASQTHETAAKLSSDVADKAKHSELSSEHARMSAHHKDAIVDMGPAASKEWTKGRMKEWASKKTR